MHQDDISDIQDEAINLLSLDGGGVRGVSSLVILDEIMTKIRDMYGLAEVPKPCEFFHMMAGTSTGGLIAIMLGRLRMSTKEALQAYDECAAKIFSSKNRKTWSLTERFRATALQQVVETLVKERGMGEDMHWDDEGEKGHVLVCVMPSDSIGKPRLVRSFPREGGGDGVWDMTNFKIWEAARATTAASSFFKPQKLVSPTEELTCIDAAIGVNNPVEYLLEEAVDEFGSGRRLGCVVSIGTGTRGVRLEAALGGLRNLIQAPGYYINLIKTLKSTATDGEETHRRLQSRLLPFPGSYYRFNVPEAAELVKLHHYKKIPVLKSLTARYLAGREIATQVCQVAEALKTDAFDHGLTLGHVFGLDREQVVLSKGRTRSMGMTSRFFTGRQDILERLDAYFCARNTGGRPRREFLLHGMPGVGKSEIAVKFSEMFEDRLYIFYIDGSMPATISQSYAEIAKRHGLAAARTVEAMKSVAMQWMEDSTEEWLLIFDDCNVNDRQAQLPGRGKGNIIYTSRSTALRRELPPGCAVEVNPFSEADAVDLLLRASGCGGTSPDPDDMNAAQAIVGELGCLPLAIDKAAASIRDSGWTLSAYLEEFRARKVGILSNPRFVDRRVENPTVYATLELAVDAIKACRRREGRFGTTGAGRAATLALKILGVLSFYHHQAVPVREIWKRAAENRKGWGADILYPLWKLIRMGPPDPDFDIMLSFKDNGEWNTAPLSFGLDLLTTFSLIKHDPSGRYISMHVLVHRWARHRMKREEYLRYSLIARIIALEALGLPSEAYLDIYRSRVLAPHIEVCCAHRSIPLIDSYEGRLMLQLGWHYHGEKKFSEAEKALLKSLQLYRIEFGHYAGSTIETLRRLGLLYHEMGRLGEAELALLEVIERLRGKMDDIHAAMSEQQAEEELKGRKGGSKTFAGLKFKRLPTSSFTRFLGGNWKALPKKGGAAKPCESGQVAVGTNWKPPCDWDEYLKWNTRSNLAHADLGRVYMDQDRYPVGVRMLMDALKYLEKDGYLSPNDLEFVRLEHEVKSLTDPGNFSYWHQSRGPFPGLQTPPGVPIPKAFWQSEIMLHCLIAQANCLLKNGMWHSAFRLYRECLEISEMFYGHCDRHCLEILRRMVDCMVERDDCDFAISLARDCVGRARSLYGERHKETALALEKLHEAMKADLGPKHLYVRRWARFAGDTPPKNSEEYNERVRACFGPHSSWLLEEPAASVPDTDCDGKAGSSGARGDRPPVYDLCSCGEVAHAEGSQRGEKVASESRRPSSEDHVSENAGAEETRQASMPKPSGSEGPDLAAASCSEQEDENDAVRKWYKLRNMPLYRCGMYYPFLPDSEEEVPTGFPATDMPPLGT
ncbi:hypothetical protein C8A03DRAFT_13946 [Achaetomium macrosporum]|uniref:PNPLA domain-containing protein n=1 Tax=Achaetomium macrosporum TaxID=79813 RepID=A0AAN7HF58_9PEZI|nr:hypothetical protein C8A03DRAFT_13946 [Achaetomium macrosporum]